MFRGMCTCNTMQADPYYNRLLKSVKQYFSCRTLYTPYAYFVYLFISCVQDNPLLYSFLNIIGANRLGGETTRGETTRGETSWGRND